MNDRGDESAPGGAPTPQTFEGFIDEHYQGAYRFALSLAGNHSDACDLTQQAFYLAHARSHQLRDASRRKQWLFSILYREFLRDRRRAVAHQEVSLEFSEPQLSPINVDYAQQLDGKSVLQVLQEIEENFRVPLALFYLNQLSYKEIAAALKVPIGTVMSRLARGKQMLRQRLESGAVSSQKRVAILPTAGEGESHG